MIRTERLRLVPATLDLFEVMAEGDEALGRALGVRVADEWVGLPDHREAIANGGAAFLREHPGALGWWTYLFVHEADQLLIGVGGLKGEPVQGAAEIGYALAPSYRGRGLATEAALALTEHAFARADVRRVLAHTLPGPNPSTRVLQGLGFSLEEAVDDPDDGEIWRWSIQRPA